jgi:hypothetical protein
MAAFCATLDLQSRLFMNRQECSISNAFNLWFGRKSQLSKLRNCVDSIFDQDLALIPCDSCDER